MAHEKYRGANQPCYYQRSRRVYRGGHPRSFRSIQRTYSSHRRAIDGRDGYRRRFIWKRKNVSATSSEVRTSYEKISSCARTISIKNRRQIFLCWKNTHGYCQRRCARYWEKHSRHRTSMQ